MDDNEAKVTVYRFDPDVDKEPRYETYRLPPEGWRDLTVLDTIRYIYEHLDGSLSFRESCRVYRVCSSCLVMMNKKLVLACDAMSTKEMILEPVPNYPIIKDLVVSFTRPGDN